MTNSATTQAYSQDFELALLNIFLIYDLLEHMKGLVLKKNHSHRIPMTLATAEYWRGNQ